jgi:CRP-like cAMP-binding protein
MTLVVPAKKLSKFDPKTFLSTIDGGGRKIAAFPKKKTIFVQGDPSDCVFYIQNGKIKLTVVSRIGKEAAIGILNEGDFFGEGCLTGQPLRLCSATAMTDCSVMRITKKSMMEVLHREQTFSDLFVAYLLTRNIRYEEDLVDQLFNSSEKRLARILLLLAHFGKEGVHGGNLTTARMEWRSDRVVFTLMNGVHQMGSVADVIKTETYSSNTTNIPQTAAPVGINLWCFKGTPARNQWAIIRDFRFVPH